MEDILPHALVIGVDYELFWTLNPKTMTPFTKAFSLRQQNDDVLAWVQGQYIQLAIASALSKDCKYPSRAFTQQPKSEEERMNEIKNKFMLKMEVLNARF